MSSFTEARHQEIGDGLYQLVSDDLAGMWFYVGKPTSGLGVLIPNGFITDGPSIPSWLEKILTWLGLLGWVVECLLKASAVHDRLREDLNFNLIDCDCYFLVAMKADQKNWSGPRWACGLLREAAFLGVRTNTSRLSRNRELASPAIS